MRFPRSIRCPNCGRRTRRAYSCHWCKYPIRLGRYERDYPTERPVEVAVPIKQPRFFYGYIVVAFACLILTITQGTYYSFGVFFKPLSADFGWTRAMTSAAFSLCTVLCGFLFIFTGRLTDTIGPRFVLTICGISLGTGYILMSQISNLWQLYIFYGIIVAIGMSGGYIPMLSMVSRWFVKRRALMAGFVAAGTGIGTLLVPPIANWLISEYDWRNSYLIMGIASAAVIILAAQFLKRDPGQVGQLPYGQEAVEVEIKNSDSGGLSLRESVGTMPFWMYSLSMFCFFTCLTVVMVHIIPHATDIGISPALAAGILAVVGATGIVGRIAFGGLADRIGNKLTYLICFALIAANLTLLLVARDLWLFYVFAVVLGLSYGGFATLIAPVAADLFGLRSLGVILGAVTFGGSIGGAIGPIGAGRIFDVTGSYQLAFIICIILSLIGLVATLLLRPAYQESSQFAKHNA